MTSSNGPGGSAASGPPGEPGPARVQPADDRTAPAARDAAAAAPTVAARTLEAIAADLAAGRLTPRDAALEIVEGAAATATELAPAQRAELRELLTDLVTNDPYLGGLVGRI
jgi:hypothetical protein